jgi:S1-C subfamily serine protease
MRYIFILIASIFFISSSHAYDESIKLNRTNITEYSGEENIKVTLNGMQDFKNIKKVNKKHSTIEKHVKLTAQKFKKKGKRIKYRGSAADIYSKNADSVVYIMQANGIGTGSIINKKGLILTNWHVIEGVKEVQVWFKPKELEKMDERILLNQPHYTAKVIKINKRKDLALIQLNVPPKTLKPITFGKLSSVPIGSTVYAIGHPKGETWTFNSGMVSQIRPNHKWSYEKSNHKATVIQHEVPTNPGNSGGPLFSEKGLFVGVNSFTAKGQLINFSVAVEEVSIFLKEKIVEKPFIKKKKKPSYITKKCKKTSSFITKKCKEENKKKHSFNMKNYPNAKTQDANENGKIDTWYVDTNRNGIIDTAFIDDDGDGIIEALLLDNNENQVWEVLLYDEDLNGSPDIMFMDKDENGKSDVRAYDYNQDGEWDKFEKIT